MARKEGFDIDKKIPLRAARKLYVVPNKGGKPGYQLAEYVKSSDKPDEVVIRRWESQPKRFFGTCHVPKAHLIHEPAPDDPRLAAIDDWIAAERHRAMETEQKRQAAKNAGQAFTAAVGE